MLTKADRKRGMELSDKATPGEWEQHTAQATYYIAAPGSGEFARFENRICEQPFHFGVGCNRENDAAFIAESRTLLPAALKDLDAKDAALGNAEGVIRGLIPHDENSYDYKMAREALAEIRKAKG